MKAHCWYSETQANMGGTAIYLIDGRHVHVTDASQINTPTKCFSLWPDMVYVGYGEYLSQGREGDWLYKELLEAAY